MSQAKSSDTASQTEFDHLSEQISALKSDISSISKTLANLAETERDHVLSSARGKVADLRVAGEKQLHAAQHRAEELGEKAADAVRNQPATAVGLAIGAGFLLGYLTGRK